jgi:hypothetical protein
MVIYIQISNFDIDSRRRKRKDEEMNHFKCFVVNRSEYQSEIKSSMMLFSSLWQAAQLKSMSWREILWLIKTQYTN